MSFWHALYLLLIYPLQLFFELVFSTAYKAVGNYGFAIIWLSIVINLVVLPLYIRADKIQKEQRIIENKLNPGISHIKSAFKGDERFMMLQMYYKINHYHPAMSLRSAASLLLQIPFFMAAYNMLSTLRWLNGVPFWFIRDLGQPDALFTIGTFSVNILPILMTLINVISSAFYTRGSTKREKVQVYGMAALFLVLLYNSASALAFYWMLNNVFSLVKNVITLIIEKCFPGSLSKCKSSVDTLMSKVKDSDKASLVTFILSSLINVGLLAFCIPTMLLVSSVQEFVEPFTYGNPVTYILNAVLIATGVFVVWGSVIYWLLGKKGKRVFAFLSVGLSIFFCANFFYEPTIMEKVPEGAIRFIVYILVMVISFIVFAVLFKYSKFIYNTVLVCTLAGVIILGAVGVVNINNAYSAVNFPDLGEQFNINLSTEGNNVVVIMLDRALGVTVEDEFAMISGLEERFDGFTYYPNTVSFGAHTNLGSPALAGGYEYTPYQMNLRSDESLEDKQNEAVRVMPLMFSNEGYDITVVNAPYAGYQYISDTSVFADVPDTDAYVTDFLFNDYSEYLGESVNVIRERNLFFYGLCYAITYGRDFFYDNGNYNYPNADYFVEFDFERGMDIKAEQYFTANEYNVLRSLSDITSISESSDNTFFFLNNEITHGEITPFLSDIDVDMDLDAYYNQALELSDGNEELFESYMSNGVAFELLGEWFDYLREQGVYDNTRIIIVSDHGYYNSYLDGADFPSEGDDDYGIESYIPVLFVKDFGAGGFTVSQEFSTNADVPYLASLNLIDNPVNPYTGNPITNFEGCGMPVRISFSHRYNIEVNNGNAFMETYGWYDISDTDDLFNIDNWSVVAN